ncbi:hypothetical protein ACFJIW_13265 [Tahibacter sp. UC22_41]|jgi:hypothetical protein|uniref:hypothetical protein n=1 Tax=Tahibacter sp. UC22_41 TaxID=3350178 RepID=UPI0036DD5BC8
MRIPTITRTVFLSLALLSGGVALAQQPQQPPQNTTKVPPPSALEPAAALNSMAQFDVNKDGFIDKSEIPSGHELAGKFARLDRNSDGKLDASEFAAYQDEKR